MDEHALDRLQEKLNLGRFDNTFLIGIPVSFFLISGFYTWQKGLFVSLGLPMNPYPFWIYPTALIWMASVCYLFAYFHDNLKLRLWVYNFYYYFIVVSAIPFGYALFLKLNGLFYASLKEFMFLAYAYNYVFFLVGGIYVYRILGDYSYSALIRWLKTNAPMRSKEIEVDSKTFLLLWPYRSVNIRRSIEVFAFLTIPESMFIIFSLYVMRTENKNAAVALWFFPSFYMLFLIVIHLILRYGIPPTRHESK